MRKRDLFYYLYENSEKDYVEITNLIVEIAGFSVMTDEQELYMKDLIFRLLFGITFLEKSGYTTEEILAKYNGLFDENKLIELKTKYSIVIDIIREKLNQVANEVEE